MKTYKIAVKWELTKKGNIQLYDDKGHKLPGKGTKWEGSFACYNNPGLTSLEGAPESVGGSFDCSNNPGLTSLEGAPESVGGYFACYNNPGLTSLEGAPESVGGYFDCYNNPGLTSLEGAPKPNVPNPELNARIQNIVRRSFIKKGYILADGILTRIVSKRKAGKIVVYKTTKIGNRAQVVYVVQRGEVFSHGETIKKASHDLRYKLTNRDTTFCKKWNLDSVHATDEVIRAYRAITGACETGTKGFCEGKKLPARLSIKVAIRLTKGAYGADKFATFFVKTGKLMEAK